MIIEGEFYSGGHLRWNLGWPTPNYAGAFLVSLLALLWIFSGSRWRWTALALEAGGLFLLAKTYSRGALVAWGAAWLFGFAAVRGGRKVGERWVWAARVGVLAVMMLVVGFGWSRADGDQSETMHGTSASDGPTPGKVDEKEKGVAREDGSVVNRLALWRGGLQMIAAAPWTGWGAGESGRVYMNWFQDLDRDEGYATMVNSYLHVAAEHGLLHLAAVLWVAAWFMLAAWSGADDGNNVEYGALGITRPALIAAAGASLVGWLVANVFTTLWIEPKLWIIPGLAAGALLWLAVKRPDRRLGRMTCLSGVIAGLALATLFGAGRWLGRNETLEIRPGANDTVWAKRGIGSDVWHVWADPAVLGPTPGKELRRWLVQAPSDCLLVVHRAGTGGAREVPPSLAERVVLMGRQAERLVDFKQGTRRLRLVHPRGMPPFGVSGQAMGEVVVFLPEIDEAGDAPAWRRWAKESGARIVKSPRSGLDVRALWPDILYANR